MKFDTAYIEGKKYMLCEACYEWRVKEYRYLISLIYAAKECS